jgi:hypothetical protein
MTSYQTSSSHTHTLSPGIGIAVTPSAKAKAKVPSQFRVLSDRDIASEVWKSKHTLL